MTRLAAAGVEGVTVEGRTARGSGTKPSSSSPGRTPSATTSGWLSSGSIDHGRFDPGALLGGRYRIVERLGRGGMGEVYRADDLKLGQPVALKFLPPEVDGDPVRLTPLHTELRIARQVSPPNVCRVYDIDEVDGHTFRRWRRRRRGSRGAARRIGRFPRIARSRSRVRSAPGRGRARARRGAPRLRRRT